MQSLYVLTSVDRVCEESPATTRRPHMLLMPFEALENIVDFTRKDFSIEEKQMFELLPMHCDVDMAASHHSDARRSVALQPAVQCGKSLYHDMPTVLEEKKKRRPSCRRSFLFEGIVSLAGRQR